MNKSSISPNPSDENAGDEALDMLLDPAPVAADKPVEDKVELKKEEAPQLDGPPALARLDEATRDLLMPSESDEPFRVIYWPLENSEITPCEVALYLTENADACVETKSVDEFFQNAASIEDWMDDEEKANAKRFEELVQTIEAELENPRVYLVGERERTAAILGKVAGGFAGVATLVVET